MSQSMQPGWSTLSEGRWVHGADSIWHLLGRAEQSSVSWEGEAWGARTGGRRRGCTGLLEVSPEPGRREHLVKQAKGSACHPVPWDKAVELLVAVCACSSEQAADAGSLHKSGSSSTALRKKKIHPRSFKHKDISDSRGPDRGHCSVFSQQGPVPWPRALPSLVLGGCRRLHPAWPSPRAWSWSPATCWCIPDVLSSCSKERTFWFLFLSFSTWALRRLDRPLRVGLQEQLPARSPR